MSATPSLARLLAALILALPAPAIAADAETYAGEGCRRNGAIAFPDDPRVAEAMAAAKAAHEAGIKGFEPETILRIACERDRARFVAAVRARLAAAERQRRTGGE
jgi:hypothetical protein